LLKDFSFIYSIYILNDVNFKVSSVNTPINHE
jgi:hypothetical protein